MDSLYVIKVGGGLLEDPSSMQTVVRQLQAIDGKWLLVHGGGRMASELAVKMGHEPKLIDGRRVTDAFTIQLVTMVYAGLVNKTLVASLNANGIPAIGLSGADGGVMTADKRPPEPIDFGFVGDLEEAGIKDDFLVELIEGNRAPVMAPITMSAQGELLNTNADTIASMIARKMSRHYNVTLLLCFEMEGVLLDQHDPSSRLGSIDRAHYQLLREQGIVSGGMIPKLELALAASEHGVKKVWIGPGLQLDQAIHTPEKTGTWIIKPDVI